MSLVSTPVARRGSSASRVSAYRSRVSSSSRGHPRRSFEARRSGNSPRTRARAGERNERERRRPAHRARVHPRRPNAVRNVVVRETHARQRPSEPPRARHGHLGRDVRTMEITRALRVRLVRAHAHVVAVAVRARWGETVDRDRFERSSASISPSRRRERTRRGSRCRTRSWCVRRRCCDRAWRRRST